jgi:hypothetical protein
MDRQVILDECDAKLAEYENQMCAHEDEIRTALAKIKALREKVADVAAMRNMHTSSFLQLPSEALSRILHFSQCVVGKTQRIATPWIDLDPKWGRYMLVCRRVRAVAISTPSLWTTLYYESMNTVQWIELSASRAKGCPVNMCGPGFEFPSASHIGNYYPRVMGVARKARRMYIPLPDVEEYALEIRSILEETLPCLEVLQCFISNGSDAQYLLTPTFLGGISLTLTSLTLPSVAFGDTDSVPSLPALTYLTLRLASAPEGQHLRQLAALLNGSPLIDRLSIESSHMNTHLQSSAHVHILLPRLRAVHLKASLEDLYVYARLLPHPSHHLSITTTSFSNMSFSTVGRRDSALSDYVQDFWTKATERSQAQVPSGCLDLTKKNTRQRVTYGNQFNLYSDCDHSSPHLYLTAPSWYPDDGGMPFKDSIETAIIGSWSPSRIAVMKTYGSSLRRVIIKQAKRVDLIPADFMDWLRARLESQHSLQMIEFVDCGEGGADEFHTFGEQLKTEGLVKATLFRH